MDNRAFQRALRSWHSHSGRHDLPWLRQRSPYRIWVAEILLQQTQVRVALPYYQRFMRRFPSLKALAEAPLDELLSLWSGLGYYARARNLHRTAQQLRETHGGRWPRSVAELQALPGIGRSTAGAIAAAAFRQRGIILDGNVRRVLARFATIAGYPGTGATERQLWRLADHYTPERDAAEHNQAMMDLGATVCTHSTPNCPSCPLHTGCAAWRTGRVADFPARRPRRPSPLRHCHMLLIEKPDGHILLERRAEHGLWGGLYSLPEIASAQDPLAHYPELAACGVAKREEWAVLRHTFTHFRLDIHPLHLRLARAPHGIAEGDNKQLWYNASNTTQGLVVGLPTPVSKLLGQWRSGQNNGRGH